MMPEMTHACMLMEMSQPERRMTGGMSSSWRWVDFCARVEGLALTWIDHM